MKWIQYSNALWCLHERECTPAVAMVYRRTGKGRWTALLWGDPARSFVGAASARSAMKLVDEWLLQLRPPPP